MTERNGFFVKNKILTNPKNPYRFHLQVFPLQLGYELGRPMA